MDEHEEISYKTLRRLQQGEQASSVLIKINVNFYQDLSNYIRKIERNVEQKKNPLINMRSICPCDIMRPSIDII